MITKPSLDFGLRWHLFKRILLLQASWNAQRMQNLGLLYCLLAWLRIQPTDHNLSRRFFRRYYGFFNTNPYLAGFLVGGLVRLETERSCGADISRRMLETYRDSLGRAFASLGDQLFWLGLRPAVILVCCLFALDGNLIGILLVFVAFNMAQLGLRWWSLEMGYRSGLEIPSLLGHPYWHYGIQVVKRMALMASGLVVGRFLQEVLPLTGFSGGAAFGVGIVLGLGLPMVLRKRLPGEFMLVIGAIAALGLGFAISLVGR